MLKRVTGLFVFFVFIVCQVEPLQAAEESGIFMGIITGGEKGTYYQFGLNVSALVNAYGIDMDVYNSNGSVENIYAVYKRPRTQLGIVQSDVLAFVSKVQTDETLKRIAKKIKMVFPLYNEEIHLLGVPAIAEFDDLAGKRVAIGTEGSGTYLTARLLFEVSGITPGQTLTIGLNQALEGLKSGSVDAMFYVAGYPVKLFAEGVTADDGLHLIPITNKSITEFYPQAQIPAATYSWQNDPVDTAAVKAVLVSFDFRNYHCTTVGRVGRVIYDNLEWLQANGHPKWRAVNLDYKLKGWEQYDCVRQQLAAIPTPPSPPKRDQSMNPVLNAIKEALQP
ncbi:TAXI family TRAP transporter solute-binding subunit [Desulfosarcina ovata]|uniref:C4-dicarboxylate ABC transporter substrate-binding protein n=2 Tax=Desulfosarcina ovata TaxID=83564 RepID=A0A5K8AD94_9BACT|nr:TAXI family TRAP transporter solute-binding subunit [Desulfosarcina ovata]BBO84032.1 C4-dicarboxylate ABC transporter substrate-binding protein [Desulfosarcina ovata subsp. sediminis]BBO90506.1 C4-dicarboxylate ABC transporter substrate-binding protein [Desulfosarcina ovata subsp. ovata]